MASFLTTPLVWTRERINMLGGLPSYDQLGEMIAQLPAMARKLDELEAAAVAYDGPEARPGGRVDRLYKTAQNGKAELSKLDRMVRDAAEAAVAAGKLRRTPEGGYGLAGWPETIVGVTAAIGAVIAAFFGGGVIGLFVAGFLAVLAAIELGTSLLQAGEAAIRAMGPAFAAGANAARASTLPIIVIAGTIALGMFLFRPKRGAA